MASEPNISSKLDDSINVNALRAVDPRMLSLQGHATHVVLYSFKPDTNEWEKVNIEGALFIYSRKSEPKYNMTVINRLNMNNLVEPLNGNMNLQVQEPFLLYRNGDGQIFGIWFYSQKECTVIARILDKLIRELCQNKMKNGVDNMISRLSVSEGSSGHKFKDGKILDGTSKRVLDFFEMAKNSTPSLPPGSNKQLPGVPHRAVANKIQQDVKPLLHRLMSNPNQPVQTVEQIEKQHMSTTPRKESAPIDIIKISPHNENQKAWPKPLIVSEFVNSSIEKKLENGLGFVRIPESSPHSPPGIEPLDRPGSSSLETPNKVPLFTPNMFMTSHSEPEPKDTSSQDLDLEIRPQPLTKGQLLQAVSYLLKNDPDFVTKLHEAYVKSFSDRVS